MEIIRYGITCKKDEIAKFSAALAMLGKTIVSITDVSIKYGYLDTFHIVYH